MELPKQHNAIAYERTAEFLLEPSICDQLEFNDLVHFIELSYELGG